MKTLPEVIKALEICTRDMGGCEDCPYCEKCPCDPDDKWDDAIYYLKDMENLKEDYDILYDKYWRDFNKQQENPPLTPDELIAMKGKPIWIEQDGFTSQWGLITHYTKKYLYVVDANFFEAEYEWDGCGGKWTAYRKERNDI